MNNIEQFAKISPIVNENGVILIKNGNTYSCNIDKIKLKDKEVGICISFKNKALNKDFLDTGTVTINEDNEKYLVRSLITMINDEPIKLAGSADSASINQFPGLDVDIFNIDTSAFIFEKIGSSYKITGFATDANGNVIMPKIVDGAIIMPYEYKGANDEDPISVTAIDGDFDGLEDGTKIIIPYSIDMMNDGAFSNCELILTKHVLIF